jgi:glycosyltransferase involved in cell wall biosynthesis
MSVVIPVYNGGMAFRRCLDSLAQWLPRTVEVIVVVDGQDAESVLTAEQFGARVLQLPENCGPAHARNMGASHAQGEILFFIDADVTIHPSTIAAIDLMFEHHADIDALIGSYDDAPGSANFLSQYRNLLHHYTHQQACSEASTFWGACGAIRRNVFLAMGGFNTAYRDPCIEDIELGYRLKAAGYRIYLSRYIQVKHLKRWTIKNLLKADLFYRAIPWTELIWRDRALKNDLNLDYTSRFSIIATYSLVLALGIALVLPGAIAAVALCALILVILNWPVYQFFGQKRGLWFALRTIPWHWLYYGYSGLGFILGTARYWWNRDRIPQRQPAYPMAALEMATSGQ